MGGVPFYLSQSIRGLSGVMCMYSPSMPHTLPRRLSTFEVD